MSRWLKILLLGVVVAGVALLALPWWLPTALRPILGRWNITFEHYEREGYGHFRLRQLRYASTSVEVTAGEVHAPTPLLWLGQRLGSNPPTITAENWRVQPIAGPRKTSSPAPGRGWPWLHDVLRRVTSRLATWLPHAELANGEVRGLGPRLYFARVVWRDGQLHADGFGLAGQKLAADITPGDTFVLKALNATEGTQLQLAWLGAAVKGTATWWAQPLTLDARFPQAGWLPDEASVVAENWAVPAGRLALRVPYAEARGNLKLAWRDGAFDLSADATALPGPDTKKAPPFTARAAAHGNLRALTVTALTIDAPFATGRLSAPVTFSLDEPAAAVPAQLSVKVDLAQVPWIDARGRAEGTVTVSGRDAAARQDFALDFENVELADVKLKSARARGRLQWPTLALTELVAQLDDANTVNAHGEINWRTRELAGVAVQATLTPTWFSHWLPAGTAWQSAELSATAEGPLAAPRHTGTAKIRALKHSPLKATDLEATWRSAGKAVEVSARTLTGTSTLEIAGSVDADGLQLDRLALNPGGKPAWTLVKPVRATRFPVWSATGVQLSGPAGDLAFSGQAGREASFDVSVRGFNSALLADWVTLAGPAWELHTLQAKGAFEKGALAFSANATARIAMEPRPAEVTLAATGDAAGVRLQDLTVTDSGRTLTHATGRLPLAWVLDPSPHLRLDEEAPLELSAATEPDSPLWATLGALAGVQLVQPAAKIELSGTAREPAGDIQIRVAKLSADPGRFRYELPELTSLSLAAHFARDGVTLGELACNVDGQTIQASGTLPMDDAAWQQLWQKPAAFDWSRATGRIDIPAADLAPLARRFPKFVAAQGVLRAKLDLQPGGNVSGELHLSNAASRPLSPFGTLQEIEADLQLAGRTLTIGKVAAKLGGEPVSLSGRVEFGPDGAARLALGLKGRNLPVVRNPGLLLRADIDLQANTNAAGVTTLGGAVDIRDCLLLASLNLRTLLPTGIKGVTRQPPYFSIEAEPFAHWPLAVEVTARKSIRLRTSVFTGSSSARFRLGGTLAEPRAVGEVTVDEGRVLFPFATFTVKSGSLRLREEDPFRAVVALTATSQRRDYQLQMEASGELPSPNILLSSSPALEPGEVLLLVMTGQQPQSAATTVGTSGTQRLALLGAYLSRGLFQDLGASGEDRLEISAGTEVSEQGRDTYEFEYKLGRRTSLVGEYDRFDSYNVGLKWRAYTQESIPVEKK